MLNKTVFACKACYLTRRNVTAKEESRLEETTTELEVISDQYDPNSPLYSTAGFEDPELGL